MTSTRTSWPWRRPWSLAVAELLASEARKRLIRQRVAARIQRKVIQ